MKIISLLENTTRQKNMQVEHGLSLYIETKNHKILFDMGQSELFYKNAASLGVELLEVDTAILSHGHYDHGGGLKRFLELNRRAPVFINKDAFLPHYNGTEKYIGLDTELINSPQIAFTGDEHRLDEGLTLFTCNGIPKPYPCPDSGLNERVGDEFIPDDFRHEQYLLIEEEGKRVLISGCSHKGILNLTQWFRPDVLVGGFHYSKLPLDDRLLGAARLLDGYPTKFYTCHCTGVEQYEFMKRHMKNLNYLSCGQMINI